MRVQTALTVVGACLQAVQAIPADKANAGLRLVKTSEQDPGQWVTEAQKFELFTSKNIGFIDITDITDDDVLSVLAGKQATVARRANYPEGAEHRDEADPLIAKSNTDGPKSWLKTFSDFYTRHYQSDTGVEAATWLFEKVKSVAASNSTITVKQFKHTRFNQPSLIATIPGKKKDAVVIGAHMDSTGGSSRNRSPGADDNGSGSVTILEVFRVLAEAKFAPENTLEFHWYAGEEGGLLGSADVFRSYKSSGRSILAMLNQDMTGYSPSKKMAIFTDNVDPALTEYVRALSTEYIGTAPNTGRCGYGCSDHASARSNGFPAAFAAEDTFDKTNPNIHSDKDTYESIEWDAVERHINFTLAFAVEASHLQ